MKTKLFTVIVAVLSFCAVPPAFAITIGFTPSSQSVSVGSTTTVELFISGLEDGAAPSLGAFDLDIGFDSRVLGLSSATFGNQLDLFGLGDVQFITFGKDYLNVFEVSLESVADLDSLQSETFVLATLLFDVLGSGSSLLSITVNALVDSTGDPLHAELVAGNVVSVGAVPEPASLLLIGVGLVGMIALAMRRGRQGSRSYAHDISHLHRRRK